MGEAGQDLKVYMNRWIRIDYPITSLAISEMIDKKEFYVVRMDFVSSSNNQDQISAYFDSKKWGDALLNLRIKDSLRAVCVFEGFGRKTSDQDTHLNNLLGSNCELL
jgi:hypothetical protein